VIIDERAPRSHRRGAAEQVRRREVSAVDLTRAVLARSPGPKPNVGRVSHSSSRKALAAAAEIDRRVAAARIRSARRRPGRVKDNICTAGLRTTAGSRILERFVPAFDATVTARLRAAGRRRRREGQLRRVRHGLVHRELGARHDAEPVGPARVPGGSSGGSAVAVAARECYGALGTDTGGSVRLPSAFCGVVG
jgi:aspartyl-tRNA(Asn)/glutamyl-tRNA(Gln) amidotransferase subunit A